MSGMERKQQMGEYGSTFVSHNVIMYDIVPLTVRDKCAPILAFTHRKECRLVTCTLFHCFIYIIVTNATFRARRMRKFTGLMSTAIEPPFPAYFISLNFINVN